MAALSLSRRRLLRISALSLPLLLGGCRQRRSHLLISQGDLPALWFSRLPAGWAQRSEEDPAAVAAAVPERASRQGSGREGAGRNPAGQDPAASSPSLVQLWDGWATALPAAALQPFGAPELLARLDPLCRPVSRLYGPAGSPQLAFPWAVDPWVLLLRDRPDLARRADEGWQLLLDPSLRGKLVLPSSPRITLSLVQADPSRLRQLRRAALASDERHGLSLLLSGEAEALVVPRRRAVPLLRSDPRLAVLLPEQGAPLGWNLLLRPAATAVPPPVDWLAAALEPPLLPRLLAAGWVPPLPYATLAQAAASLPASQRSLLVPPEGWLQRCWSFPPLDAGARQRLQALWDGAAP